MFCISIHRNCSPRPHPQPLKPEYQNYPPPPRGDFSDTQTYENPEFDKNEYEDLDDVTMQPAGNRVTYLNVLDEAGPDAGRNAGRDTGRDTGCTSPYQAINTSDVSAPNANAYDRLRRM
jgi:hypothetical protein